MQHTHDWVAFFILGSAAATAQLFRVQTPRDQAYHTAIVFLIAAAFLLPPELVALMGIVQHIPEWLKIRYRWYLQTFNICNYVLGSMAVWFLAHHILGVGRDLGSHACASPSPVSSAASSSSRSTTRCSA